MKCFLFAFMMFTINVVAETYDPFYLYVDCRHNYPYCSLNTENINPLFFFHNNKKSEIDSLLNSARLVHRKVVVDTSRLPLQCFHIKFVSVYRDIDQPVVNNCCTGLSNVISITDEEIIYDWITITHDDIIVGDWINYVCILHDSSWTFYRPTDKQIDRFRELLKTNPTRLKINLSALESSNPYQALIPANEAIRIVDVIN